MELSAVQLRTFDALVDVGDGRTFPPGLEAGLRRQIEDAVQPYLDRVAPLRLWKERLNDLSRCEGLFLSNLSGEGPSFEHSTKSAAGTLRHKVIELEATGRAMVDPHDLAERAVERLEDDRPFARFWSRLDPVDQDGLLMSAVQTLESFRASFPPFPAVRRAVAPVCEHWLEASLAGGAVMVTGKVDLMLNRADPVRSTRVLIDLKSGKAWPEHPEDMRLYALLYTLRYGIPPYRVATLFLTSGEPQLEDVTEEILDHAAVRVIEAVRSAAELTGGEEPDLRPGPHCGWCPRRTACPAAAG